MADDASGWKTVYHTKQTEEQRGTITKHYETITRAVTGESPETGEDKTLSSSPDTRKTAPIKTVHTTIFSEDVKVSSPYDRGFFERLISECESFGKDRKGAERVIKVEMSDGTRKEGGDPRRCLFEESSKRSGEEENVHRYVYRVTSPKSQRGSSEEFIRKESSVQAEIQKEDGTKKTRHVQWDDEKPTDKINTRTDAKEGQGRINYANLNAESRSKENPSITSENPIHQRKTYKDWAIFKEKLLKEFEDIPKPKREEHSKPKNEFEGIRMPNERDERTPTPSLESSKPRKELKGAPNLKKEENTPSEKDPLTTPKSPRTRCRMQKKVHVRADDWELNKQVYLDFGVEECKQREQQMAGNLKEIREIVQDVRKLSQKFPRMFESGGLTLQGSAEFKTSPNGPNISNPVSNDDVVYVTEIKFPVNVNGYKSMRTTAI